MASSVQERLQMNRTMLDKWSTREKLCLTSAVGSSGDQNWMSVSRTLKLLCGGCGAGSGNNNENENRPIDWFSQKNCALQYGQLLENVETPKRKKRSGESASGTSSPVISADTSTDLILRRLTDDRIQEMKADIRKDQEEYAKICAELKTIQSGQLTEEQMMEMWREIEKVQEMERIEEMKLDNQMREREQQKQEMQRNWRPIGGNGGGGGVQNPIIDATTTMVDMDVEEIIGTANVNTKTQLPVVTTSQQQQQGTASTVGTSPLLSSLLKSQSSSGLTTSAAPSAVVSTPTTSARTSAPTITTLLTSSSIPHSNQPIITLKSSIPANEALQLLSRPIFGPPVDSQPATANTTQNLLSPSQSAPTLSMLLEKNKITTNSNNQQPVATAVAEADFTKVVDDLKSIRQVTATDSNNEEVPMDLDEDIVETAADISNSKDNPTDSDDLDDPNEEQQLLEVFKNIGNIDDLNDIDVAAVINDEEVVFLKDEDESPSATADGMEDFNGKIETEEVQDTKEDDATVHLKMEETASKDKMVDIKSEESNSDKTEQSMENQPTERTEKIETISSDDSNDNIPLAAVASLENKERTHIGTTTDVIFFKEKVESAIYNEKADVKNDTAIAVVELEDDDDNDASKSSNVAVATINLVEGAQTSNEATKILDVDSEKSPTESENSDVIVIPTDDDESNSDKQIQPPQESEYHKTSVEQKVDQADSKKEQAADNKIDKSDTLTSSCETIEGSTSIDIQDVSTMESSVQKPAPPPPTISITDTTDEDDSSTTDVSIITRKVDEPATTSITVSPSNTSANKHVSLLQRKSIHEVTRIGEQKIDDNSAGNVAATSAKPPMLRKLRDRDRSESPMIDSETSANTAGELTTTTTTSTNQQRSRRRYSSTHVIDSIPNSPTSSDRDRSDDHHETRLTASKKSLLSIYNALQHNKQVLLLQRAFHEDQQQQQTKYEEICLRPMDLHMIKKNIESGAINSVSELQRDFLLMCHNTIMLFETDSLKHKAAFSFLQDCQAIRDFATNYNPSTSTNEAGARAEREPRESKSLNTSSSTSSSGSSVKGRSSSTRKSQRLV